MVDILDGYVFLSTILSIFELTSEGVQSGNLISSFVILDCYVTELGMASKRTFIAQNTCDNIRV